MERIKKGLVLLLTVLLCMGCMTTALAATATQDNLQLDLTTNAAAYDAGELMIVTLKVTNTGSTALAEVKLEAVLPEGCTLPEGAEATRWVEDLDAGETAAYTFTCVAGLAEDEGAGGRLRTLLWIFAVSFCAAGVVAAMLRRGPLTLLLCAATVGLILLALLSEDGADTKIITVSQPVSIENRQAEVMARVEYDAQGVSEAESYYRSTARILEVKDAATSKDVQTEKEVIAFLAERGFPVDNVLWEYSLTGEYIGEQAASPSSSAKHPVYMAEYRAQNGDHWVLYVIDGRIFANSLGYNLRSDTGVQLLVSESGELVSYDDESNSFFVNIPQEAVTRIKAVDRIDSDALDRLTKEELEK